MWLLLRQRAIHTPQIPLDNAGEHIIYHHLICHHVAATPSTSHTHATDTTRQRMWEHHLSSPIYHHVAATPSTSHTHATDTTRQRSIIYRHLIYHHVALRQRATHATDTTRQRQRAIHTPQIPLDNAGESIIYRHLIYHHVAATPSTSHTHATDTTRQQSIIYRHIYHHVLLLRQRAIHTPQIPLDNAGESIIYRHLIYHHVAATPSTSHTHATDTTRQRRWEHHLSSPHLPSCGCYSVNEPYTRHRYH